MEEPNYENYSRSELEYVLSSIDATKHPDRVARVRALLDEFDEKSDVAEKEHGFWSALFGKDIGSVDNAKKILKATFFVCVFQLIFLVALRLFFPDLYSKAMAQEIIVFTYAAILLGLGCLIQRQNLWATYVLIFIVLAPNLYVAYDEKTLPDFSSFEFVLIFMLISSIRSIQFIKKSENSATASQ